jgi:hypothetical protein
LFVVLLFQVKAASLEVEIVLINYLVTFQAPYVRVRLGIGPDLRPEWSKLKMASETRDYCGKSRKAETQIVVLSRGLFDGEPATKVRTKNHCFRKGQSIVSIIR